VIGSRPILDRTKPSPFGGGLGGWLILGWLLFFVSCRNVQPLPAVNIHEPGWTVRQGQAVWQSKEGAERITGDLLLATRVDGQSLVQFSKMPFPTIVARISPGQWQAQFFPQNRTLSGRGQLPVELLWFQLPDAMAGKTLNRPWRFEQSESDGWRLRNEATGEYLEGYLAP
jgi:hypothetical protein